MVSRTSRGWFTRAISAAAAVLVLTSYPTSVSGQHASNTPLPVLTHLAQIRQLTPEQAARGYPVRIRAVVTYYSTDGPDFLGRDTYMGAATPDLFVQDSTSGIYVNVPKTALALKAGQLIDLEGVTEAPDFAPQIGQPRYQVIGNAALPKPNRASLERMLSTAEDSQWVETQGVVRQVKLKDGRLTLDVAVAGGQLKATVPDFHQPAPTGLVDAEVQIRGACGAIFNKKFQLVGILLYVPDLKQIDVFKPAPADPFLAKVQPIETVARFAPQQAMGHRVRAQGIVTLRDSEKTLYLSDGRTGIRVDLAEAGSFRPGDRVDVLGFPRISDYALAMEDALCRRIGSQKPLPPMPVTAEQILGGDFDSLPVTIEGRLLEKAVLTDRQSLVLTTRNIPFDAELHQAEGKARLASLPANSILRVTGICVVDKDETERNRSFKILLNSADDIAVVHEPPWWTVPRALAALGVLAAGTALLILAALAWVGLLRKHVHSQTQDLLVKAIQLQEANRRTREALQKAREAESVEMDRQRVLGLVARDEPVPLVLEHIAEAIAVHSENAVCAVLMDGRVSIVPPMPAAWRQTLERIDPASIGFAPEDHRLEQFSADPVWASFLAEQCGTRFKFVCAVPIRAGSHTAGVIAAFFGQEIPARETHCAQLRLWSSIASMALERRHLYDQLSYRAQCDGLTGLPNRASLYDRLEAEIAHAERGGTLLGVLYVDLDGFKEINDTFGHSAGDQILKEVSQRMVHCVRRGDTVARIGGDEFVLLLPLLAHRSDAEQLAAKITAQLRQPVGFGDQKLRVGASLGISIWPVDGRQPDVLLKFADAQMYGEKNTKKRRWYEAKGNPFEIRAPYPQPDDVPA